jgi:hypothetical protein
MPDIWLPSPEPCREDPEAGHDDTAATKVELAATYRTLQDSLAGLRLSSPPSDRQREMEMEILQSGGSPGKRPEGTQMKSDSGVFLEHPTFCRPLQDRLRATLQGVSTVPGPL